MNEIILKKDGVYLTRSRKCPAGSLRHFWLDGTTIVLVSTAVGRENDFSIEEDFHNLTGVEIVYIGKCKYKMIGENAMAFALEYC